MTTGFPDIEPELVECIFQRTLVGNCAGQQKRMAKTRSIGLYPTNAKKYS